MSYNLRILYYYAIFYLVGSLVLIVSTLQLKKNVCLQKKKKDIIEILACVVLSIFAIYQTINICYAIGNPVIKQYQGIYLGKSRGFVDFEEFEYSEDEDSFRIPRYMIGRMCPDGLKKKNKYIIYYENHTEIIVKIQKIS